MKQLIRLVIKLGIPVALIYAAYASNPGPQTHREAIAAKTESLQKGDVMGQLDSMMHAKTATKEAESAFTYHNYFVCSKVTGPEGATASYGFFKRVFVTKSEL